MQWSTTLTADPFARTGAALIMASGLVMWATWTLNNQNFKENVARYDKTQVDSTGLKQKPGFIQPALNVVPTVYKALSSCNKSQEIQDRVEEEQALETLLAQFGEKTQITYYCNTTLFKTHGAFWKCNCA